MAILTDVNKKLLWIKYMSDISARRESTGLLKVDLRAAIDAIDQWIDSNATSFNAAIPLPARTVLSTKQKAELFMLIIQKRWEVV